MNNVAKIDRRDFIRWGGIAGGGLVVGVYGGYDAVGQMLAANGSDTASLNAFVQIDTDGIVSIWVAKVDMGQGVRTSLPMIVADELDVDWDDVRVVQADAHPDKYGRMMTVGSSSVRRGAWMGLRQAGASAREMLVAAAAARWSVAAGECRTEMGSVIHSGSGRRLSYADLAEEAAAMPVPEHPTLKDPSEFRYIGTPMKQLDTPAKVRGEAVFGIDARPEGLLFATVFHCPTFGGSVASFDATESLAVSGVRDVFEISSGIAVVADNTWAAFEGADKLDVTWNKGDFAMSSADIFEHFAEVAEGEGAEARSEGDIAAGMAAVETKVEAVYQAPYLAHATMEPMNCTVHVQPDRVEVWVPTQGPQGVQSTAARLTGIAVEKVTVHPMFLGGGLGRRGANDFVTDAVETAMKVDAPVQVLWTREEDMRHDLYRPAAYAKFEGGVDADGNIAAYRLRAVAQPLSATGSSDGGFGGGRGGRGGRGGGGPRPDRNAVEGLVTMPYEVSNLLIDYGRPGPQVRTPTGYWRSVGPSHNCWITESIIDELAHAAGRDPLEFRLSMLGNAPRIRHVLEVAAQKANWSTPLPEGRARGIGLVIDKGGYVAQIAEVSVELGALRVHKVTCAADYGFVINPLTVDAQTVGCIVNGLAAALYGEITLADGGVVESNFHNYELLRIDEMPEVDIHLIDSDEEPGGAGEPALPPIAPAVTNAIFALTGKRIRRLPIKNHPL
ncbi:MAG: xanthine dehydrogenase family protein molybdopterin-binding subunit [Acidobacteria bacterium]|nr:xanthine dehydrogenase family protein molybdopterin-binding subunit [Acidobacteriota bacterium]